MLRKIRLGLSGLLLSAAVLGALGLRVSAQDATSSLLQLLLMGPGLHQNDWGGQTNTNLSKIESAIAGTGSIVVGSADYTLTDTEARNGILVITGTLSNSLNVIAPARTKSWVISNQASGAFNVTFRPSGGTGVVLPTTNPVVAWSDGATMRLAVQDLTSINSSISAVTTVANGALQKAGGTMTGAVNFGAFTLANGGTPSSPGDLTTKSYVDAAITTGVGGISAIPSGAVMAFNLSSCPSGWLAANGTAVALDLRGEFIRGLDSGRGVDASRTLASAQSDLLKSHAHTFTALNSGGGVGASTFAANAGPGTGGAVTATTDATGGAETRPRNVALLYCVKS